jgi:uncharacterized protein (DUF2147 family)
MMRFFFGILLLCNSLIFVGETWSRTNTSASAFDHLPGLWQQVDDHTGRVQALIRITRSNTGLYSGVVEKIIPAPGDDPDPKCEDCRDHRRNQRVLGMQIIDGLRRTADMKYEGGEILDPDDGRVYRLRITVLGDGTRLDVRGYLGISLFGRSQVWQRAPAAP